MTTLKQPARRLRRCTICHMVMLVALVILLSPLASPAEGTGKESWSEPFLLTGSDSRLAGFNAAMVGDPYGYVHVFWIEIRSRLTRAIVYSRFDGTSWTRPLELFVTRPQLPIGDFIEASIDQNNRIHLAWLGGAGGPVLITSAMADRTLSTFAWTEPYRAEAKAHRFRLLVDAENKQHLIFTAAYNVQPGIYYMSSSDDGQSWSRDQWLNPEMPQTHTLDNMQAVLDPEGRLHVVWSQKELDSTTSGGAIMYTRSLDAGASWEPLVTIDSSNGERLLDNAEPSLAVIGDVVHVLWAGGDVHLFRNHRYSVNGGQTWNMITRRTFDELHGQAQGDALAVDAMGQIHFVGHVRWPEGLYHAAWNNGQWTRPSLFYLNRWDSESSKTGTINAHGLRAVVRAGNQIVTTFYDRADEQLLLPANGLYAMSYEIPEISTASVTATATVVPATVETDAATAPIAASASPTPTPAWAASSTSPLTDTDSPATLLWAGILPALLIVIAIGLVRFIMKGPLL